MYILIFHFQYIFILSSTFDPYERGRLTECIRRFQRDSVDIVEKEVSRLTERVKMFSAEKMASEYRKLFNEISN